MIVAWWLLLSPCLLSASSEPLNFGRVYSAETSFFAPQDDSQLGVYSGFSFNPSGGVQVPQNFQAPFKSETSNIPVYTDGVATPPQATLSQLEKDYTAQLHRLANSRASLRPRHYVPKFRSEPFPSASNVDERKPSSSSPKPTEEIRVVIPKSKPVELQTGFIPIIKGSTHDQRKSKSLASTVIKDIEPPILTAAPGSLTSRPTLLKVSASVQSSSKVPPASGERQAESSPTSNNEVRANVRQAGFSRFLNYKNDSRNSLVFPPSFGESVVSRAATRPESILDLQQKELLRLGSPRAEIVSEESKTDARRTLEINCDSSSDLGWCELDDKYPKKYVNQMISSCPDVVDRMHVEVPHSFEKLSDTSDFKAELDNSSQRSAKERGSHDAWSWASYFHQGSLCEAETGFLRPETAKDTTGTWNIIVQTDAIKQRVPIEMCRKTNSSCKKMLNCGLKSQCLQKYNYHLLLSLNPTLKHDCPFMKLYRFPSACVCHVE